MVGSFLILAFSVSRISIKDNTERPARILCFKFGNESITNLTCIG